MTPIEHFLPSWDTTLTLYFNPNGDLAGIGHLKKRYFLIK